jgi:Histidine kinase-like ATPase domain
MTGARSTLSTQAVPVDRIEPRVMEAHEACLVDGTVGHWLAPTVEMAARVSGDWLRSDFAAMRWASFPGSGARTPGLSASRLRSAREFTMSTLRRWSVAERCDDIVIVVSELLTNALLHALPVAGSSAAWPIQLGLLQPGDCVMCAVTDPSRAAPVPRKPGYSGETSRGLHIVAALSDQWGYIISAENGKVIWALFSLRRSVRPLRPRR